MKIKTIYKSGLMALSALFLFSLSTKAQEGFEDEKGNVNVSVQWQFNVPVKNNFVHGAASGWGANVESTYALSNNFAVGLFTNWHTNNKYIPRQTYTDGTTSITMDQKRSLFQLPFGFTGRYNFMTGQVQPYVGLKLGANFSRQRVRYNIFTEKTDQWGFYTSPEIGATFYPEKSKAIGFNVVGFYSYSTNKYDGYVKMDGINNLGFRVGIVIKID